MAEYLSPSAHFWLHTLIDSSIGLSYICISITLAVLVYRTRNAIPYHYMLLAFGGFILSCGLGHFSHIWTMFYPDSRLEGYIGAVTALSSMLTAVSLPPLVPKVIALVRSAELSEQRQQAIRQRDEFLAILSHELKTPMTVMHGYADLLQRRIVKRPDLDKSLVTPVMAMVTQTARLHRTIMELLQMSRLQLGSFALQRSTFDLADLVQKLVQQHQVLAESSHTITLHNSCGDLSISGDEHALEQVVHNLLTNAVKYSPDGGAVEVTLSRAGHLATIVIADEGVGVPEADRGHLFERFYRATNADSMKIGGFGIGLYIVREIVERHGGSVSYAPKRDRGSIFTVTLPCQAAQHVMEQRMPHGYPSASMP